MAKHDAITPTEVETSTGFSEFAKKDHSLRKTKKNVVDGIYYSFLIGLRANSSHAVYLGNRVGIGGLLKRKLTKEGFNPICKPANDPVWIAVELGS